jgi:hypothetical protein
MGRKITLAPVPPYTPERPQHSTIVTEAGPAHGKSTYRVRPALTPYALRIALLEEAAEKPRETRDRSLRRKLTALDRALSDGEARALDRYCTLIEAVGAIGCVNYRQANLRSDPSSRLPFSEWKQRELAAHAYARAGLSMPQRALGDRFARALGTARPASHDGLTEEAIESLRALASTLDQRYRDWDRTQRAKAAAGDTPA